MRTYYIYDLNTLLTLCTIIGTLEMASAVADSLADTTDTHPVVSVDEAFA